MPRSRRRPRPCSSSTYSRRSPGSGYRSGTTPGQREEEAGHPHAGVAQQGPDRRQPAQRQAWSGHQCVGVEHPDKHQLDEEALNARFGLGQLAVVEVRRHDDRVVGPVPRPRRGSADELHPQPDARRAQRAAVAQHVGARASAVSRRSRSLTARHQGLPGSSPSTGLRTPRRSSQPIERPRGAPVGQMQLGSAWLPRRGTAATPAAPPGGHAPKRRGRPR